MNIDYTIIKTPTESIYNEAISLLKSEGLHNTDVKWEKYGNHTILYYNDKKWLGADDGEYAHSHPSRVVERQLVIVPKELFEL